MIVRILAFLWCCLLSLAERANVVMPALMVAVVSVAGTARADCAGASVSEVRGAYDQGLALDNGGDTPGALAAFVRAQQYTCEFNPVALDAARRAAALALPLAMVAERGGQLDLAFEYYEGGGYFAAADRVLVESVRELRDDLSRFDRAVSHFSSRAQPAFGANERTRLSVTGDYTPDRGHAAELADLPARRAAAALAAEAKKFDQEYLRAVIDLERLTPRNRSDVAGMQNATLAQQRLASRWPSDPLAKSRALLATARAWARRDSNQSRARGIDTRVDLRYADRANTLVKSYSASPRLLEAAMDYYRASVADAALVESDLSRVRAIARQLAERSGDAGDLHAAARYYDVAGDDAMAEAAREQMNVVAQSQMAPMIKAAQRQAIEMARAYGSPEQVEALRSQIAEVMQAYPQTSSGIAERGTDM